MGSADYTIGTRIDAQLGAYIKGLSGEQRRDLIGGATGAFKARAEAFRDKYHFKTAPTPAPEAEDTPVLAPTLDDDELSPQEASRQANHKTGAKRKEHPDVHWSNSPPRPQKR